MAVVEVRNLTKTSTADADMDTSARLTASTSRRMRGVPRVVRPVRLRQDHALRTIAGLEEPTEGEVLIGGNVVNGLPPRLRRIAMVFQSYALYPHKTVLDNIVFPLKAAQLDKAERETRPARRAAGHRSVAQPPAAATLRRRTATRRTGAGNGTGTRSSCWTSRCPTSTPNYERALGTSSSDQQRVGTTTIYVTHDQSEAMGLGDRIA